MTYTIKNKKRIYNPLFISEQTSQNNIKSASKIFDSYLTNTNLIGHEEIINNIKIQVQKLTTDTNAQISLVGKRGVGKTIIVKQLLMWAAESIQSDHFPNILSSSKNESFYDIAYIDFKGIPMTPEGFACEYIRQLFYQLIEKENSKKLFTEEKYTSLGQMEFFSKELTFEKLAEKNISQKLKEPILAILNELEKITPNQEKMISLALSFPEIIAEVMHKKIILGIDNIDSLFELENYKSLKNIANKFKSHTKQILYLITSNKINKTKEQFSEFTTYEIEGISRKETELLLIDKINSSCFKKETIKEITEHSNEIATLIHKVSDGNPEIIIDIVNKFLSNKSQYSKISNIINKLNFSAEIKKHLSLVRNKENLETTLEKAIPLSHSTEKNKFTVKLEILEEVMFALKETIFQTNGNSYKKISSRIEERLAEARGKTLLSFILKNLAKPKEDKDIPRLRLNAISRKIYRSAPVTKNLLIRLKEVDLIEFKNNHYFIKENLLRIWLYFYYNHLASEENTFQKLILNLQALEKSTDKIEQKALLYNIKLISLETQNMISYLL